MDKFFLKSKTIIGILLTLIVSLAPAIGLTFGTDDAHLISELWDKIAIVASAGMAVIGRFTAKSSLKVK